MEEDIEAFAARLLSGIEEDPEAHEQEDADDEEEEEEEDDADEQDERQFFPSVPTVMQRARFEGACNVETVKDGKHRVPHLYPLAHITTQ